MPYRRHPPPSISLPHLQKTIYLTCPPAFDPQQRSLFGRASPEESLCTSHSPPFFDTAKGSSLARPTGQPSILRRNKALARAHLNPSTHLPRPSRRRITPSTLFQGELAELFIADTAPGDSLAPKLFPTPRVPCRLFPTLVELTPHAPVPPSDLPASLLRQAILLLLHSNSSRSPCARATFHIVRRGLKVTVLVIARLHRVGGVGNSQGKTGAQTSHYTQPL